MRRTQGTAILVLLIALGLVAAQGMMGNHNRVPWGQFGPGQGMFMAPGMVMGPGMMAGMGMMQVLPAGATPIEEGARLALSLIS